MEPNLNLWERFLNLFTQVRAGEGKAVLIYFTYAALIILSYYVFKTLREPLIIGSASAEAKSYATALAAFVLLLFMPIYSRLFRRYSRERLVSGLALAFAAMGVVFACLYSSGASIGYPYYVWVSIYGVVMVTQFWAFATGSFNVKTGKRLFPVILMGSSLGGLLGAKVADYVVSYLNIGVGLMMASLIIAITACLPFIAQKSVPGVSHCVDCDHYEPKPASLLGGISTVFNSKLMILIAIYALLLNIINSTGEYIFADLLISSADEKGFVDTADREKYIGHIYAKFAFWTTAIALLIQMFIVSRVFIWLGVCFAAMIMPMALTFGYMLGGMFPVFTCIYMLKIIDNSLDYSITNTVRQTLFLPATNEEKFEAKTAIDTLFWRLGDLIQAGIVFVAVNWLGWGVQQLLFAMSLVALVWFYWSLKLGQEYRARVREHVEDAPVVNEPIGIVIVSPGSVLELTIPSNTFVASDPSDELKLSVQMTGGAQLPEWLTFSSSERKLSGDVPPTLKERIDITLTALDNSGLTADSEFSLQPEAI